MLLHPNCPNVPSQYFLLFLKYFQENSILDVTQKKERFKCLYLLVETAMALRQKEGDETNDEEVGEGAGESFEETIETQESIIEDDNISS